MTMKLSIKFAVLGLITIMAVGCNKDENLTPSQMLEGQWTMTSQTLLSVTSAGDGSYLRFDACSNSCSGVDYKASNMSSGNFNYVLNADATLLTIVDTTSNGGNWDGTWDILDLTETTLRITGSTPFGNLTVQYSK